MTGLQAQSAGNFFGCARVITPVATRSQESWVPPRNANCGSDKWTRQARRDGASTLRRLCNGLCQISGQLVAECCWGGLIRPAPGFRPQSLSRFADEFGRQFDLVGGRIKRPHVEL